MRGMHSAAFILQQKIKCILVVIIYVIYVFTFIDWLKMRHVIKNKLTIAQKLP